MSKNQSRLNCSTRVRDKLKIRVEDLAPKSFLPRIDASDHSYAEEESRVKAGHKETHVLHQHRDQSKEDPGSQRNTCISNDGQERFAQAD